MKTLVIHDSDLSVVGFLDNSKQTTLNYFKDKWHRDLASGSSTYTFSVYKKPELFEIYQHLSEQNWISFTHKRKVYLYSIMTVEEDENYITCYCENLNLELINETVKSYESNAEKTLVQYCTEMGLLSLAKLTVGINEIADRKRKLSFTTEETKLARLLALVKEFDAELDFDLELNDDSSINRFNVNFYQSYDNNGHHGVGRYRDDIMLMYGKNIGGVTRKTDKTGLYTMIRPVGKKSSNITTTKRTTVTNSDGTKTVTERTSNSNGDIVTTVKTLDYSGKVIGSKTTTTTKNDDGTTAKSTTSSTGSKSENSTTNVDSKQEVDGSTTRITTTKKADGTIQKTIVNTRTEGNKTITRTTKPDGSVTEKTVTRVGSNSVTQTKIIKAATNSKSNATTVSETESDETFDLSSLPDAWQMKNADGVVEFYKKGDCIYAPIAAQMYPAAFNSGSQSDQWISIDKEFDAETPDELLVLAYEYLKNRCYPSVEYTIKGHFDGDIGDTFMMHDGKFRPALDTIIRITTQEMSFSDPDDDQTIFSNIKVLDAKTINKTKQLEEQIAHATDGIVKIEETIAEQEAQREAQIEEQLAQKQAEWQATFDEEINAVDQQMAEQQQTHDRAVADILSQAESAQSLAAQAKAIGDQAKVEAINLAGQLSTAKTALQNSIAEAKVQAATVANNLATAKSELQNQVTAIDAKAGQAQRDITQAKSDLQAQAAQLNAQADKQVELTKLTTDTKQLADGTITTLNELSKTVDKNTGNITSVTNRTKVVEDDLSGTKTKLEQVKTTADTTSRKTAELQNSIDGVTERFENLRVGGRNYINDYSFEKNHTFNSNTSLWKHERIADATARSGYHIKATCTQAGGSGFHKVLRDLRGSEWQGRTMTYAVDIKASKTVRMRLGAEAFKTGFKTFDVTTNWQRFVTTDTVDFKTWYSFPFYTDSVAWAVGDIIYIRDPQLEDGNVATTPHAAEEDFSNQIAEYKRTADQNYSGLQSTVQTLDGKITQNKSEVNQTATQLSNRLTSLETYKNAEGTRAQAYFEASKTETAKQIAAERTAITQNYVAKSTYQEDAAGVTRRLTATETVANRADTTANSNVNTITQHTTQITALNNELSAKVSKTDYDTLTGRVTGAETAIKVQAGEISKRLTSTQVESAITTKGYQTKAQVDSNIAGRGYITSSALQPYVTTTVLQNTVNETSSSFERKITETKALIPTEQSAGNMLKASNVGVGPVHSSFLELALPIEKGKEYTLVQHWWSGSEASHSNGSPQLAIDAGMTVENKGYYDAVLKYDSKIDSWFCTFTSPVTVNAGTRIRFANTDIKSKRSDGVDGTGYWSFTTLVRGSLPLSVWQPSYAELATVTAFNSVKDTVDAHKRIIGDGSSISSAIQSAKKFEQQIASGGEIYQAIATAKGLVTTVSGPNGLTSQVSQLAGSYAIKNLTSAGTVLNQLNLNKDGSVGIDGSLIMITGKTYIQDSVIKSSKIASLDVNKITGLDANFLKAKIEFALVDWMKTKSISSQNGAMVTDYNNSKILFNDNLASIIRIKSNTPSQFIKLDKALLKGYEVAHTVIGSNRTTDLSYSDDAFTGIRILNGATADEVQVIGDTISFSTGINVWRGWQMKTIYGPDARQVALKPMGNPTRSYIYASNFMYGEKNIVDAINALFELWTHYGSVDSSAKDGNFVAKLNSLKSSKWY